MGNRNDKFDFVWVTLLQVAAHKACNVFLILDRI